MTAIAAQVSLYPLRQERLGPAIEQAIGAFRRHPVAVWEGMMSTVLAGELDAVMAALRDAFVVATAEGEAVMVITLSNGCPVPASPAALDAVEHTPDSESDTSLDTLSGVTELDVTAEDISTE